MFLGPLGSALIDLSKATKLKNVVVQFNSFRVEWLTTALQTITPKHRDLRQITIGVSYYVSPLRSRVTVKEIMEEYSGQWLDLDRLLVQLWESRSIRLEVCTIEPDVTDHINCLLPEVTERGIIDLVGPWR